MKINIYYILFLPSFLFSQNHVEISINNDSIYFIDSIDYPTNENSILYLDQKKSDKVDFHVAFLLPFCADMNDILDSNLDSIKNNPQLFNDISFYNKSAISIDFFLGFLMSLDNFSNTNIKISVFDIKEGEDSKDILIDIIDRKYLKSVDLVVGPLFTENFLFFANNFKYNIPLVAPFSKKEKITSKKSNVIQIQSNIDSQIKIFSEYIFNSHPNDHILLVHRDTILENNLSYNNETGEMIDLIDTIIPGDIHYSSLFLSKVDTPTFNIKEIKVSSFVIDSIHHELDTLGLRNIVIIPSEDNVFVTDLLSKLHACRDTNLIVYGLPSLFNFNHIPVTDLMDMKISFPYNKFDYDQSTDQFIFKFYESYHYVPNIRYSTVGYEIGLYFINMLVKYTEVLPYLSVMSPERVLESIYDFRKTKQGGYENQGVMILRYNDFGYERIY